MAQYLRRRGRTLSRRTDTGGARDFVCRGRDGQAQIDACEGTDITHKLVGSSVSSVLICLSRCVGASAFRMGCRAKEDEESGVR